jgi:hypothetical protein
MQCTVLNASNRDRSTDLLMLRKRLCTMYQSQWNSPQLKVGGFVCRQRRAVCLYNTRSRTWPLFRLASPTSRLVVFCRFWSVIDLLSFTLLCSFPYVFLLSRIAYRVLPTNTFAHSLRYTSPRRRRLLIQNKRLFHQARNAEKCSDSTVAR